MVDVIKSLGIDYIFSNPGSSFLGLHESIVNYGGNKAPEFITCMHEESAVAMANGYYKAAGKPATGVYSAGGSDLWGGGIAQSATVVSSTSTTIVTSATGATAVPAVEVSAPCWIRLMNA